MRVPIGTLDPSESEPLHVMRNRVARKHIPQKEDGPGLYEKLKKEELEEDPRLKPGTRQEGKRSKGGDKEGGSMPKKAKKAKKAKIF